MSYAGIATELRRPGAGDLASPSATGRPRRWSPTPRAASRAARPTSRAGRRAAAQDVLVEFERLRTLSASTAQVTFRDLSRLRLNPNSNAIIQRMRSDPLTGGEVTKVSLVNGDFYALLNQLGDRTAFEVGGARASRPRPSRPTSGSSTTARSSRFANYDAPALEITRGGETISLGENEGAVVPERRRGRARPRCWRAPSSPRPSTARRSTTPP